MNGLDFVKSLLREPNSTRVISRDSFYWNGVGSNFVLEDGQIGVELSSSGSIIQAKVGDGSTKWHALIQSVNASGSDTDKIIPNPGAAGVLDFTMGKDIFYPELTANTTITSVLGIPSKGRGVLSFEIHNPSGFDFNFDLSIFSAGSTVDLTTFDSAKPRTTGLIMYSNGNVDIKFTATPAASVGTGAAIDSIPPSVTFSPVNGASNVPMGNDLTITFGEAVRNTDGSAINDSNVDQLVTLRYNGINGTDIPFDATINAGKTIITVNPDVDLEPMASVYLAIGATVEDANDNIISAASSTFTTSASAFNPLSNPNLEVWIDDSDSSIMFQEPISPTTPVTLNNDLIGTVQSKGALDLDFDTFSNSTRPRLALPGQGGRNSAINFTISEATDDKHLRSIGGEAGLKFVHGAAQSYTFLFYIQMESGTDGIQQMIATNNGASTTLPGFMIWRRTDNSLTFRVVSNGGIITDHDSTFTITEADGLVRVEITCSGVGAGQGSMRKDSTEETFTTVAGVDENANGVLIVGGRGTTALWNLGGFVSQFMILSAPIDSTFRTEYESLNPAFS
jgi:hypothetical protein